ncbi:alpha/beta fold hydrolase [Bradyrhizobium sp. SYSU BS000235]|uniref:alpha/beta fold hydrolase n=1 Tax=Bradyrhizobium sp. SYSU BS000235 TaxID=3411332 RepID=UPI003C720100
MKNLTQLTFAAAILLGSVFSGITGASAASSDNLKGKTVVLVHGAFADGSSWNKVIPLLEAKGLKVVAVQNPLSSLNDDVAATRNAIDQQTGPVVLVGHSWAGVVITQAGANDKVKALVYVAAFAPDRGQSIQDMLQGLPAPSWASALTKDAGGYLRLSTDATIHQFAQDVPESEARLIAATQGVWAEQCSSQKVTEAAWHNKPTWDIVTTSDRMIPPDLQDRMAKAMGARTTRVSASHVVMLSHPQEVADTILAAAEAAH